MSLTLILLTIVLCRFYVVSGRDPMVTFAITVPSESVNKVIFEGDLAVIKCTVPELPRNANNVGITVVRNGQPITSTMESQNSASVTFSSVSTSDSGQYECIVSYSTPPGGAPMTLPPEILSLMVYMPSSSPVCVHDKPSVHVGDELQLSCYFKFNSDATPTYQWQRLGNGASVLTSSVSNLAGNTGVLQTDVGPLQMEEDILFICFNTMDVDNSRCTIQIMVQSMIPTTQKTVSPVVNETSTKVGMTVTSLAGTGSSTRTSSVLLYVGIVIVLLLIVLVVAVIVIHMFRSKGQMDKTTSHRDNIDHVYDNPVMRNLPPSEGYERSLTHLTSQSGSSPEFVNNRNNAEVNKDDIIVAFGQKVAKNIPSEKTNKQTGREVSPEMNENEILEGNGTETYNVIEEMYVDMSDSLKRGVSDNNGALKVKTFPLKDIGEPPGERRNTYMIYEENDDTSGNDKGKDVYEDKVEYTDMGNCQRSFSDETSVSTCTAKGENDDITVTSRSKTAEDDFSHFYSTVNKTGRTSADNHVETNKTDNGTDYVKGAPINNIPVTGNIESKEDFSHLYTAVDKKAGNRANDKNKIGDGVSEVGLTQPRFVEISPEEVVEEDYSHLYSVIDKTKHIGVSDGSNQGAEGQNFNELYSEIQKPHKNK